MQRSLPILGPGALRQRQRLAEKAAAQPSLPPPTVTRQMRRHLARAEAKATASTSRLTAAKAARALRKHKRAAV